LSKLYNQTINAYDEKLYLVAAIGLRALLEAIIILKVDKKNYKSSLESKIESLRKYFSDETIDTLHDFRFMGNQAAHNFQEPDRLEIHRALNVIENIMTYFWKIEDSVSAYKSFKEKKI